MKKRKKNERSIYRYRDVCSCGVRFEVKGNSAIKFHYNKKTKCLFCGRTLLYAPF